jgi:alanyl-tRNA synthetase
VRRIEALTGLGALADLRRQGELLSRAAEEMGVAAERLPEEASKGRQRVRALEEELSRLRLQVVSGDRDADSVTEVEGVRVLVKEVDPAPSQELRTMADVLRARLGEGVVVLATREGEKVSLVVTVTDPLSESLPAGRIVKELAKRVGGGGGGRADFAQAGGREPARLSEALAAVPDILRQCLADSTV